MKQAIRYPNLALRFALELCMLAALGIWGYHAAQNLAARLALAIGAPLIAAIAWGMFVAPRARISVPTWLWVML
ncbi:MAG TPA: YrdB family protein, partial [Roseiflexaceae bacterium]|nr:YrdB family protein [Roseiflexaceae bacterium]